MNQKWKTLLISVLTPSGIISGIALTVLWGYFSRLDRLDVFFEVMSIKSLFAMVCCAAVFSLAILLFIFFIISIFMPIIIPLDINNLPTYNKIQNNFFIDTDAVRTVPDGVYLCILLCFRFQPGRKK